MVPAFKLKIPTNPSTIREGNKNTILLARNFTPSQEELDLLDKGLSFIPTTNIRKKQKETLKGETQEFHRKLKLAAFFEGSDDTEYTPFMPKSNWEPKANQIPDTITDLIRENNNTINALNPKNHKDKNNLSRGESQALFRLAKNKHIIIKPADKGSAIVIMDRTQYIHEAHRQLNNTTHYKKLMRPIYMDTALEIQDIIQTLVHNKHITKKQSFYLRGEEKPRPRIFYLLPKIHKPPQSWTIPYEVPAGRPIVSDCNSESYRIAEYIDHFLTPLSSRHNSYIKDTYDFINKIKNTKITQNAFLFTIDIDSLYTNINTTAGLRAVKDCMEKYPNNSRPDTQLLQLLEISLSRNDFEFDKEHYLQISGTAMGKKFAPAYANIYMAHWEETVFEKCPKLPTNYFRYLDDIWGTWTHTLEEFKHFINILNTHHRNITVKYTTHNEQIDFLDTTTYKGPTFYQTHTLDTKVFFKDTDTHALLHKDSLHPKHTFKGLIKSQLLRFHRICTQYEDFEEATRTLFTALKPRGYSRSFLREIRKTFLTRKPQDTRKILPLITTYSAFSQAANKKIKQNLDRRLHNTGILTEYKIISAFKKNKNLKDHLVSSKLPEMNNIQTQGPIFYKQLKTVKNNTTNITYTIKQTLTANTENCIYVIKCKHCDIQYIGETGNKIKTRLSQHIYNIRNHRETDTHLVAHFIQHGLDALEISGLQTNNNWTPEDRRRTEKHWIRKMNTLFPRGLNKHL